MLNPLVMIHTTHHVKALFTLIIKDIKLQISKIHILGVNLQYISAKAVIVAAVQYSEIR